MTQETEKRVTTEDILGEFGFRLVWSVSDHWADVKVYEILARDENAEPVFAHREWKSLPGDSVTDVSEAEVYCEGYVKWDGCAELDQGAPHWCGPDDFVRHCVLLKHIYLRAFELMGR